MGRASGTPRRLTRRTLTRAAFALALAGSLLPAAGGAQESRVQAVLDSLVALTGVPGATAGLVLPDGQVLGFASGMADTARGVPLRPGDLLMQGSVGKTYFGAVALQLVAEGRLELDAPVAPWFGDAPWLDRIRNARRVTLRQLLGHTSGLVRYELNPRFLEDLRAAPMRTLTPEERLSYLFDADPPFAPGEGWEYSDTNYIVVAMLIEGVTGGSAYDEIRRRFLDPLGLRETVATEGPRIPALAQGYAGPGNPFGDFDAVLDDDGVYRLNPQFEWGGGGFASSARDLARWTHHVQTGNVFPRALEGEYRSGHPAPLGPGAAYGLGVIRLELPAGTAWGHSGFFPGYRAEAYHFPETEVTVALMVNTSHGAPFRAASPLAMVSRLAAAVAEGVESGAAAREAAAPGKAGREEAGAVAGGAAGGRGTGRIGVGRRRRVGAPGGG